MFKLNRKPVFVLLIFLGYFSICFAQELNQDINIGNTNQETPIVVNGDRVEFFTELKMIVAEGNVRIEYGKSVLTCDRITVFTETKDLLAEGNVKLKDEKGTIEGSNIFYNVDLQKGKIIEATIKTDPYFANSPEVEKTPAKYIFYNGDITTCSLDKPHYHMHARRIELVPNDKIRARGVTFIAGSVPIMYLPYFAQSIKDYKEGFSFSPGMSKEWGMYLLSRYTYYLNDNLRGTLHLDWRENKGWGGGTDFELLSDKFGSGLLRYYQVKEELRGHGETYIPFKNQKRYRTQYRHKWDDADEKNHFIMELNDYSDADFLKHYFYREYEKENQIRSYMLASHNYPSATLSLMLEKRLNQFYDETERLPEIKLETTSFRILDTPLYYQNQSSVAAFTSRTAYTDQVENTNRLDTYNKLSCPFRFAFLDMNPFVGLRNDYYSNDKEDGENLFRSIFYTGFDMLTKFYRTYDAKVNSYGIEIDELRHIVTPSLKYSYMHNPTLPSERLTAFDSIDSLTKENTMTVSLENKLQTKRNGQSVDFLTFIADSPYYFKLEEHGGRFGDVNFDLEVFPNSWLEFWSDAHFDLRERSFRTANFDVSLPLKDNGKITAGYRYVRDDNSKLATFGFERQLNPKWKFRTYHRMEFVTHAIEEQEYALSRDLHCWDLEFIVNNKKKKGTTFWFALRLKAFPDVGFDFEKSHQAPKTH
ncbi:MAG: LPS assembly protein LptD [Candidatus Omnitrophica bacterium]|nr:LPS assembly protein LptD [Candidatus Omnitrophota bacterium]MDD5352183.1 LPS assembly protein LptD [Candidatus Omnitrophota bacterium]MDD5549781.1 LPS assembly protein LptD [Candidatus Omnitrophota bacterium]